MEEKILIQINYDYCEDNKQLGFTTEKGAIIYLKELLEKRLNILNDNILGFDISNGIRIYTEYNNLGFTKILSNELEAIMYLKSLYIKRLQIKSYTSI